MFGRHLRLVVLLTLCGALGCSQTREEPAIIEIVAFPGGNVIAVAPALNFSGRSDFDPIVVGDLMASELSTFPGVGVIGVNRVMAILAEHGVARIQSPRHALDVCDRLGADAILVFAITEYDPYRPVVGITAQLYARQPGPLDPLMPPGRLPGQEPAEIPLQPGPPGPPPVRPVAECQQVFNASHERVQNAVRDYADKRSAGDSPYGWRKHLASQEWFLRFCCHATARDLLSRPVEGLGMMRVAAD